jgi:hypothetical protein
LLEKYTGGAMTYDNRLIPVLREGIHIIKMILFKMLKDGLAARHPDREQAYINKLAGAVTNGLFGTPNREEPFLSFATTNEILIDEELKRIAAEFPEMKIPLTDALRVQFLCDSQEGFENLSLLANAKELGILILEREIPLPDHFMTSARRLGEEYNMTRHVNTTLSS